MLSLCLAACSHQIHHSILSSYASYSISDSPDSMQINFLGTTCFWLSYKGKAVLTDPFISNPVFKNVMFGKVKTDTAIVNDFISHEQLQQVKMVVVGHAHYDHLLDLPYMSAHMPAEAVIAGSATAHHILAAASPRQQQVLCEEFFASASEMGSWIYSRDKRIRVMPVLSDHPPHLLGITMYGGCYSEDLKSVPEKTRQWKMGTPFTFLIDMLDENGSIAFRVWFQSSGSEYPKGFFPEEVLKEKTVDVAIVSIATDSPYEKFPDPILEFLKPKIIFLAHWENFWRHKYKPVKTVQKGNPEKLYKHLQEKFGRLSPVLLPKPGGVFVFN